MSAVTSHFTHNERVLFRHCDPAGIVFYPRYFEMLNDAAEALFREALDWPFEIMHHDSGAPTVALNVEFKAPSRHGDLLALNMTVEKLGTSSLTLQTLATCGDEIRFTSQHTMVCIDTSGKPKPWPAAVAARIRDLMGASQ